MSTPPKPAAEEIFWDYSIWTHPNAPVNPGDVIKRVFLFKNSSIQPAIDAALTPDKGSRFFVRKWTPALKACRINLRCDRVPGARSKDEVLSSPYSPLLRIERGKTTSCYIGLTAAAE
jgi:hypothetical protein